MRVAGLVVPHWQERRRRYATNEEGTVAAADAVTQTATAVQSGTDSMSAFLATADPAPVLALAERTTSAFPPINWLIDAMTLVHYSVPLSWAATIVAFTIAFRTVILPAVAVTMQNSAKMRAVQPEMEKLKAKYGPSVNKDVAVAMQYREEMKKMLAQSGVSTWKTIVPMLVQTPLFVSFFFSTRKLAEEEPTLRESSFFIFDNLAAVDPYYIMPVLTSLTMLATIELGSDGVGGQSNPAIKNFLRLFAVLAIPATSTLPIVTHIYWLTSNMFSLGQLGLFKLPFIKKALNLPDYAGISPMVDGKQGPAKPEVTFQRKPRIMPKDE
jgi:YidC/Oxa1 family membrane protein insertase